MDDYTKDLKKSLIYQFQLLVIGLFNKDLTSRIKPMHCQIVQDP